MKLIKPKKDDTIESFFTPGSLFVHVGDKDFIWMLVKIEFTKTKTWTKYFCAQCQWLGADGNEKIGTSSIPEDFKDIVIWYKIKLDSNERTITS